MSAGESRVKVPAGIADVLREMVECGQGAAIVGALREREAFERLRVIESDDPEQCRRGRINVRRIMAFLASVGAEKSDGVIAVTIPPRRKRWCAPGCSASWATRQGRSTRR
jgi:hypothetical protein